MHTEIGIYQTYVMSDRKLLDQTVVDALEKLIGMMRTGPLPPLPETTEIRYEVGREEDLVIDNVRRSLKFPTFGGQRESGVNSDHEETHRWLASARFTQRSSSSRP